MFFRKPPLLTKTTEHPTEKDSKIHNRQSRARLQTQRPQKNCSCAERPICGKRTEEFKQGKKKQRGAGKKSRSEGSKVKSNHKSFHEVASSANSRKGKNSVEKCKKVREVRGREKNGDLDGAA